MMMPNLKIMSPIASFPVLGLRKVGMMKSFLLFVLSIHSLNGFSLADSDGVADPRDAELRMLRAAAKRHADDLAPMQARIRDLERQLTEARSERDAAIKNARLDSIATAKEIESLNVKLNASLTQIGLLKSQLQPGNEIAAADGYQEVTAKQLETLGERYENKKVKLLGCTFSDANTDHVTNLPGVFIETDGLTIIYRKAEAAKWIGFSFLDSNSCYCFYAFASKNDMGDYLAGMKRGTRINIRGTIVKMEHKTAYGIICDRVERIPEQQKNAIGNSDTRKTYGRDRRKIGGVPATAPTE